MVKSWGMFAAAFLVSLPMSVGAAVYRCSVNGSLTFQDHPCADGSGQLMAVRPSGSTSTSDAPSGMDNINAFLRQRDAEHARTAARRSYLALREDLEQREKERQHIIAQRDLQLGLLRVDKTRANNNLAGAVWENSLSGEMTAVSSRADQQLQENARLIHDTQTKIDDLIRANPGIDQ